MPTSTQKISLPSFQPAERLTTLHPSATLEARLDDLLAILSSTTLLPTDDFATRLQWESWQNERLELEAELLEAKKSRG